MLMIGRAFRFLVFVGGLLLGIAGTLFAVGNQEAIQVSLGSYRFPVQVYLLALLPLAAGLLVGWAYTVPARAHEFAEHWRSWKTLRQMERENKELRRSLDHALELPDEKPALPAVEPPQLPAPATSEAPPQPDTKAAKPPKPKLSELKTVARAQAGKPARRRAARPAGKAGHVHNGHAGKAPEAADLPTS